MWQEIPVHILYINLLGKIIIILSYKAVLKFDYLISCCLPTNVLTSDVDK